MLQRGVVLPLYLAANLSILFSMICQTPHALCYFYTAYWLESSRDRSCNAGKKTTANVPKVMVIFVLALVFTVWVSVFRLNLPVNLPSVTSVSLPLSLSLSPLITVASTQYPRESSDNVLLSTVLSTSSSHPFFFFASIPNSEPPLMNVLLSLSCHLATLCEVK